MKPNAELAFKVGELGVYADYMTSNAKQQLTDQELYQFEQFARAALRTIANIVEIIDAVQEES